MEIKTPRLTLRDLKEKDKKVLPHLINDLTVSRYLAVVPYPYRKKDADWFVNHCKKESSKNPRANYELGIELKSTGELVGIIGLTGVDIWDGKGTLGYWLGKEYWRQGIMYEAAQGLLRFAFQTLHLQRIDVAAAVENAASDGLIKKVGGRLEGTARRYHRAKSTGRYHDARLYGILKEDWKRKRK